VSLKPYPAYKDGSVSWLGQVPKHWEITKFRNAFKESPEKIQTEIVGKMLSVSGYRGVEVKEYDDENKRRLDEELLGYRIVRRGQLVVNTMWLNYAGLGVSEHEGHVSPAYRSYWINDGFSDRFVHYMMRCDSFVLGYTSFLTGIRPNSLQMSRDDLMSFQLLKPPVSEQIDIAAFLDSETCKIDGLISEQEKLITLLKEKRQATISHAVTKGLDPAALMKETEVEWLGQIPAHWELKAMKRAVVLQRGHDLASEERVPGPIPVVSSGGITGYHNQAITKAPTIVTGRYGTIGEFSFVEENCWPLNTALYAVQMYDNHPKYIWFLLQANKAHFVLNSLKAAVPGVDRNDIHPIKIAIPDLNEQKSICTFLDGQLSKLDALTTEANRVIELLNERRAALISAAVTGKIDVRGYKSEQEAA